MLLRIDRDHQRFRDIVKGKVKQDLQKHLSHGEMIGRQGKELISIPVPMIDLPSFRYGDNRKSGVGAGEGEEGDVLGAAEGEEGQGEAGDQPGQHLLEVELSIDEMVDLLAEELELPAILPKGRETLDSVSRRYSSIHKTGPESLRHFRRTFREAVKRQVTSGIYNPDRPVIIPFRQDRRYRIWKEERRPVANAAVLHIMDVSGSMGDQQKDIVRIASFWIDRWLMRHYKGVDRRFIIHDAVAREVDEQEFFTTRESGGTLISSAYKVVQKILAEDYPWDEWNVYVFQFSDGDNWAGEDTRLCLRMLAEEFLPNVNLFCYGQVASPFGSGQYLHHLKELDAACESLVCASIPDKSGIMGALKTFLGKGR